MKKKTASTTARSLHQRTVLCTFIHIVRWTKKNINIKCDRKAQLRAAANKKRIVTLHYQSVELY